MCYSFLLVKVKVELCFRFSGLWLVQVRDRGRGGLGGRGLPGLVHLTQR